MVAVQRGWFTYFTLDCELVFIVIASSLKAPDPFSFSSPNLAAELKMWRRQFEYYILATRKAEKDEEDLVGVLITLLGVEGLKP